MGTKMIYFYRLWACKTLLLYLMEEKMLQSSNGPRQETIIGSTDPHHWLIISQCEVS